MNFRLGLILASALAMTAAGCAAPASGPGTIGGPVLAQGERPRENAQTRAAEDALEAAVLADLQGTTPEEGQSQYQVALDAANEAIAADSTNPLPHLQAGQAYIGLERIQEASVALDRAEELRPIYQLETENIREQAWLDEYQRAEPVMNAGDYAAAAEILEGANAMYDQRPEIMIVLGQIYTQEREPDRALAHLRAAQELIAIRSSEMDSATASGWAEQARDDIPVTIMHALIVAERFEEAASSIQGLLENDPDNLTYIQNLATIYAQSDRPDSATAVYNRLLERPGLTPETYYRIGSGLYNMDSFMRAADAFERGATLAPKDRDSLEMWARCIQLAHQDAGDDQPSAAKLQELIGVAERWITLDPNSRPGLLIMAATVNTIGDEDRTQELIQRIQDLEVGVLDPVLQRLPEGGGTVSGSLENIKADPGTSVTLVFTFYDRSGNALGTQTTQVLTGAQESRTPFRVQFDSDQQVDGYGYEVRV